MIPEHDKPYWSAAYRAMRVAHPEDDRPTRAARAKELSADPVFRAGVDGAIRDARVLWENNTAMPGWLHGFELEGTSWVCVWCEMPLTGTSSGCLEDVFVQARRHWRRCA